jgi:diguanylate cyclase (GGDEF)-like protein/PAS domain S-box-containing protein
LDVYKKAQTVLLADDDPTLRMVAAAHLRKEGYEVVTAENGHRLLELLVEYEADLIVLDVDMPTMNGFEACKRIREFESCKNLPILMMTGLEGNSSIEEAYRVGATDFIAKPVNWTLLKQRLKFMLRATTAIKELSDSEARLAKAQDIAKLGYWHWDLKRKVLTLSQQLQELIKFPSTQIDSVDHILDAVVSKDREHLRQVISLAQTLPTSFPTDFFMRILVCQQGKRTMHVQSSLECDLHGEAIAIHGTVQDVTERVNAEERISFLSHFDRKTHLQNRESFARSLDGMIRLYQGLGGVVTLVLLDINRFGRINDIFGHTAGDQVLIEVASRLKHCLGTFSKSDKYVGTEICRWGSDIYGVAVHAKRSSDQSGEIPVALLATLVEPISANGHEVSLTGCIGYAHVSDRVEDTDTLVRNAETALRHAKRQGRNSAHCYHSGMSQASERRVLLEGDLQKALEENQLYLHYQPRIHAAKNIIVGAEALLRWQHPTLGLVSPVEFIPLLEEMGLIHNIGAWVFREACKQLKIWQDMGHHEFVMSVNLSAVQFRDVRLAQEVRDVIQNAGIHPSTLEVELTETSIMEDVSQTQATLMVLKEMGLRIAVDDFGTGYSSLSYLRSFPLDTLKVDRAFIRDLTTNDEDKSLATAIIAMAQSLNLRVVAEGIELQEQASFLLEKSCDEFQGFLFSKPIIAEAFTELLTSWPTKPNHTALPSRA